MARARVLSGLVLLAVLGSAAYLVVDRRTPEGRVADALRDNVAARRNADGGFGVSIEATASDAWSTSEALCGLAANGDARDRQTCAELVRYLQVNAIRRGDAIAGWGVANSDTAPAGEVTGYACAAFGLARARFGLPLDADCRALAKLLVAAQNPDGSFSSILGFPEHARVSATQDCLFALLALDGAEATPTPEVVEAVKRTCAHLGDTFQAKSRSWGVRKKRGWGQGRSVPGLSESCAWLLLEASDYLARAGATLPASAKTALREYAGAFAPQDLPLDTLSAADKDDYTFALEPPLTTTWGFGHKWSWVVWRALAVERLAQMPGNPRAADWQGEASRLRARLADLPRTLERGMVFHVSEVLIMAATLRAEPPDSPRRGSLQALIAPRR